jgi:hypothetical protein
MKPDEERSQSSLSVGSNQGPVVSLSQGSDQVASTVDESPEGQSGTDPIHWQASEYVHREKNLSWFALFIVVAIILVAVAIFLIKSWSFAILIPVMAAALVVYTRHPPRMLDYSLGRHGLHINDRLFPFGDFKSFALIHGLEQYSIMLVPVKRFKPAVTINFPNEMGEAIVDMLAARLPMRELQPDLIDRIIHKLHL